MFTQKQAKYSVSFFYAGNTHLDVFLVIFGCWTLLPVIYIDDVGGVAEAL